MSGESFNSVQSSYNNLILFRQFDSFVNMIVVDCGNKFAYFTYDMLPKNINPEKLQEIAFDNLFESIKYQFCESKEKEIYGVLAGWNFEAESICIPSIWEDLSKKLDDDIIISIPTKDIVCFTKLNDKKLCKKMLSLSSKIFEQNRKKTPELVFCKDIFIYSRNSKDITISEKNSL